MEWRNLVTVQRFISVGDRIYMLRVPWTWTRAWSRVEMLLCIYANDSRKQRSKIKLENDSGTLRERKSTEFVLLSTSLWGVTSVFFGNTTSKRDEVVVRERREENICRLAKIKSLTNVKFCYSFSFMLSWISRLYKCKKQTQKPASIFGLRKIFICGVRIRLKISNRWIEPMMMNDN